MKVSEVEKFEEFQIQTDTFIQDNHFMENQVSRKQTEWHIYY